MASSSAVFLVFLVTLACFASSMEARKLLEFQEMEKKMVTSLDERLYLTALPKGKVPASTPSNKGHAQIISEQLIARHLAAIDRILRSVPSPGVGH